MALLHKPIGNVNFTGDQLHFYYDPGMWSVDAQYIQLVVTKQAPPQKPQSETTLQQIMVYYDTYECSQWNEIDQSCDWDFPFISGIAKTPSSVYQEGNSYYWNIRYWVEGESFEQHHWVGSHDEPFTIIGTSIVIGCMDDGINTDYSDIRPVSFYS